MDQAKRKEPSPDPKAMKAEGLMERITSIEDEISCLRADLQEPEVYADYKRVGEINRRMKQLQEELKHVEESLAELL
jgi:hypothetical protein